MAVDQGDDARDILKIAGPNWKTLEYATRLLRPLFWAIAPKLDGLENIPTGGPTLFVGNHTIVFMADYTIMMLELYRLRGITLWSVGDHFHYRVPLWRDLLLKNGAIDGTYENSRAVLEAGQNLVVFPGGAREVTKRRGEQYRLLWQGRDGFARLAIDAQAKVVPFATVGGDEIFDILVDGDTILKTPAGAQVEKLFDSLGLRVNDHLPPLIKGTGPTLVPRIQRLYYHFGEPLDPAPYAGQADDADAVLDFRADVADAVERGLQTAFKIREQDDESTFPARIVKSMRGYLDGLGIRAQSDEDA